MHAARACHEQVDPALPPHGHHLDAGVDVGKVRRHSLDIGNIVKTQLGDLGVQLEQEGQGLSDAAGRSQQGDVLGLHSGPKGAPLGRGAGSH